ncbi:MAG: tRNA (adenosine(37)-N6)-threonylcarbamoyltransferase complex transferase subunit TsaD [Candidatus Omnitrophica bacterium]|nr:tRNA (adenosine(37)-N6)-threonylcarbamoyltransferase complex transferase subunit TsaD [Candidatus Omnitrophota bacterium]
MITLGIETSCDETSCAVLKDGDTILSNIVSSSLFRHQPFGGVVPEIASRHCLEQIDFVFEEALKQAKIKKSKIDLIAVTEGPGLIGSLLVGVSFAKALGYELGIPFLGVNHLEAHLVANFIGKKEPAKYIGLLVSGGHTSISYHEKGKSVELGSTVDDAVGEAYDKVAKILGLGYPGGPILDKMAKEGNPSAYFFTKPKQKNRFDFSFSGIKTAVLYETRRHCEEAKPTKQSRDRDCFAPSGLAMTVARDMAASFQKSAVSWLVEKTLDAAALKGVQHIVVGGGVSANSHLREVLMREGRSRGYEVWFPPLSLTGDNAAMIARRGLDLYRKGKRSRLTLACQPNL